MNDIGSAPRTCMLTCAVFFLALAISIPIQASQLRTGRDEQARLPFWEVSNQHMSLRLVQRLPDQSRGYFQARGFTPEQSEYVAQACVFQTIFRNNSHATQPSALQYDLKRWTVTANKKKAKLKTREDWSSFWRKQGAAEPAQIAFEWSLLPTVQAYQPGDYNWGMTVFGLKPGQDFNLHLSWQQHGKQHIYVIRNIRCAPDIHPDPEEFERND